MNTNLIHNFLNVLGLVVAALIGFNWAGLGLSAELVATIMTWLMFSDKIIKLGINIFRDGFSGLIKNQPPVK